MTSQFFVHWHLEWVSFIDFDFFECFFCVCVCVKSVANTVQMALSWQAAARMSSIGRLKCHLVSNSTVARGSTCKNLHNFGCCCCFCYCLLFNECFGYFREKNKTIMLASFHQMNKRKLHPNDHDTDWLYPLI